MKATEVQGASKEVGAKVVYQDREMTVSKGVDSGGERYLKMIDLSGVTALADALKANAALTSLKCAAPRPPPKCQQPQTLLFRPRLVCSLYLNRIGVEGAKSLAEALEVNGTLTSIEYAAARPHLPN